MVQMGAIVSEIIATVPDVPVVVHANAGMPVNVNGVDTFPETPEEMAKNVQAVLDAGVKIVGGCCGTTPAHISAMKRVVAG
jgi:5-methyltetrahydrofolate--homocysteine methyltransferase